MPSKHLKKYKLLLDEGLPPRNRFLNLNNRFDIKHIKHDLNKSAISDKDVYDYAIKEKRILITFNIKDFKNLVSLNKPSVIALSVNLLNNQTDKKICKVLKHLKLSESTGYIISISNNKTIINRSI